MTYHRDVLAKEILLQLLSDSGITPATPDSVKADWVRCAFFLADAMLAEATKGAK